MSSSRYTYPKADDPNRNCGVLGATGLIGQQLTQCLQTHPNFNLQAVGASPRSVGKTYKDAVTWKSSYPINPATRSMVLRECDPEKFGDCDIIFSTMDSNVAGDIEMAFVKAEFTVFSNAKCHRLDPMIPIIVPSLNFFHLNLILAQRRTWGLQRGFLVCNANAAVAGIAAPLMVLEEIIDPSCIAMASVVTMQAVSGAGYPGPSSWDMMDNIVPFIPGEEDNFESETRKILGGLNTLNSTWSSVAEEDMQISVACNRVPVLEGHLACVSLKFAMSPPPSVEEIKNAWKMYDSEAMVMECHSAPKRAIVVMEEEDRPQPRLDRDRGQGFIVSVGRVREDESGAFDIKFVTMINDTILGTAGGLILNAEAAVKKRVA
ncbi:MAG: hypothetical protein M1820_003721 [Bogoriella megaspora]|nr:MAG: hypothetical protein M1820_003721 [Bogoriella megaspora]